MQILCMQRLPVPPDSRATVQLLRVLAPVGMAFALLLGYFAWQQGSMFLVAVNSTLFMVNAGTTWTQWFRLKL